MEKKILKKNKENSERKVSCLWIDHDLVWEKLNIKAVFKNKNEGLWLPTGQQ